MIFARARARSHARALAAALAAAAAAALLTGCVNESVVRVMEGREVEGRFISSYAYMLYAIAADAEAHGDLSAALDAYLAAAADDDDSAEIWTRIGAVRCQLKGRGGPEAEAFERARDIDPEYEPLHREQARCALLKGRVPDALSHAGRAVSLDPNSEETALLHASLLEKAARVDEARRELRELTVRRPTSAPAWRALHDFSLRTGDAATASQAADRLAKLAVHEVAQALTATPASLAAVDTALLANDLPRARRLAQRARVTPSELAVRAAALGRPDLAREQGSLVMGADPSDASARIALAVAADLRDDASELSAALSSLPPLGAPLTPPSPLARLLYAELLDRRVGLPAARAWLGPLPQAPAPAPSGDPLFDRIDRRVRERAAPPAGGSAGGSAPYAPDGRYPLKGSQ